MAFDLMGHLGLMQRAVTDTEREGAAAKAVTASRVYDTSASDLWDALTRPERVRRWFAPVSGELKLGGRYQVEGNAGGTVLGCEEDRRFELTWEFGGSLSWVIVTLKPEGEGTRLELQHIAPINPHWDKYGPSAVGTGWDLSFMGLARHLAEPQVEVAAETMERWYATEEYKSFVRTSTDDWARADIAGGERREQALKVAEAARGFYTGETTPEA